MTQWATSRFAGGDLAIEFRRAGNDERPRGRVAGDGEAVDLVAGDEHEGARSGGSVLVPAIADEFPAEELEHLVLARMHVWVDRQAGG